MTALLEKVLEQLREQPPDMQDFIASQITELLADEAAWEASFAKSKDVLERMAQAAIEEIERGETRPLDEILEGVGRSFTKQEKRN
jgi:hypothetical protein